MNSKLIVLTGQGHGSHANPDGPIPGEGIKRPLGYDLGQLNGSLRICSADLEARDAGTTLASRCRGQWMEPTPRPADILLSKHVVYIIKENRTYDQVLGDLKEARW